MSQACGHQTACPIGQWCGPHLHEPTFGGSAGTLLLVGHANVGKSVLFHRLTGRYATVSNYPGTTVEREVGSARFGGNPWRVIDVPGVSGIDPVSDDERVAIDAVRDAGQAVLMVVGDAKQIKRTVRLAMAFGHLGHPMVLGLNMMDEARALGVAPDTDKLEALLGIPVVPIVAISGEGVDRVGEAVQRAAYLRPLDQESTCQEQAAQIVEAVLPKPSTLRRAAWRERLADAMVRPATGLPILGLVLWGVYQLVGKFGAGTAVGWVEQTVFGEWVNPFVTAGALSVGGHSWITDLLVGPYGLVTMGATYALAIVLPVISMFFLAFGLLEDSGYLPRLTILSDRALRVVGLHGKAILPTVLGFGCGTMAVLTTRILESKKERLISTLLIGLVIPCSAQLGVILGLVSFLSGWGLFAIVFILSAQFFLVGMLADRWIGGERSDFVVELPPLRWPSLANIARKTYLRVKWYVAEAVPFFLAGTLFLFILDRLGGLTVMERWGSPVVQQFLGLPASATQVLVLGFFKRDYGAAGLFAMAREGALTPLQVIVSLVTITLFIPCIASFFVMVKERGVKTALALLGFITPYAVAVGGLTHFVLRRVPW